MGKDPLRRPASYHSGETQHLLGQPSTVLLSRKVAAVPFPNHSMLSEEHSKNVIFVLVSPTFCTCELDGAIGFPQH